MSDTEDSQPDPESASAPAPESAPDPVSAEPPDPGPIPLKSLTASDEPPDPGPIKLKAEWRGIVRSRDTKSDE
jgi:hypothetical protein